MHTPLFVSPEYWASKKFSISHATMPMVDITGITILVPYMCIEIKSLHLIWR